MEKYRDLDDVPTRTSLVICCVSVSLIPLALLFIYAKIGMRVAAIFTYVSRKIVRIYKMQYDPKFNDTYVVVLR